MYSDIHSEGEHEGGGDGEGGVGPGGRGFVGCEGYGEECGEGHSEGHVEGGATAAGWEAAPHGRKHSDVEIGRRLLCAALAL